MGRRLYSPILYIRAYVISVGTIQYVLPDHLTPIKNLYIAYIRL